MRRNGLTPIIIVTLLWSGSAPQLGHAQTGPVTFYVATNGSDARSGRSPDVGAGTDGPFATVQRARDAIRELKGQRPGGVSQPVTVSIRGGTYFLRETLALQPQDSGAADAPITYAAYADERPVISGGRQISGWRPVTIDGKELWAADVPEVRTGGWYFRQLWVNGQRRTRARHPNTGLFRIAGLPDVTPATSYTEGQNRFEYSAGDIKPWRNLTDVEVVTFQMFYSARLPIATVDERQRIVTFDRTTRLRMTETTAALPRSQYYVENAFELLDAVGEWYLDRGTGTVYYLPMPGEDMRDAEVVAPVLNRLIHLQSNSQPGLWVEYVTFRNLTFSHNDWFFPPGDALDSYQALSLPYLYSGVIFGGVRHGLFQGLTVAHTGGYAFSFPLGAVDTTVSACQLHDLGAGGITLGATAVDLRQPRSERNEVADCHIRDGGKVFQAAVGVAFNQNRGSRVLHNWIHDFGNGGIALNGTQNYGLSHSEGNLVELNHVHNVGIRENGAPPLMNDLGGIYVGGERAGTKIRLNLIHDIAASLELGNGIYFDESTSGALAEQNVVYRVSDRGFHQNYGRDNVVRNNVFALNSRAGAGPNFPSNQVGRGFNDLADPHPHLTFERNIVYWQEGTLLASNRINPYDTFDLNLYWRVGGSTAQFIGVPWNLRQAAGIDRRSVIADPLFVAGDIRLTSASPAFALGFQSIDLSSVGPRSSFLPGRPTDVQAGVNGTTLNVSWTSPNSGATPTSHRLDFGSGGTVVASATVGAESTAAFAIPPGTRGTFTVTVTAFSGSTASPPSSPVTFTVGGSA